MCIRDSPRRDKDTEPAENAESPPGVYAAQEIEDAKQIVRDQFTEMFTGCTLTGLWYDGEISRKQADEWAEPVSYTHLRKLRIIFK